MVIIWLWSQNSKWFLSILTSYWKFVTIISSWNITINLGLVCRTAFILHMHQFLYRKNNNFVNYINSKFVLTVDQSKNVKALKVKYINKDWMKLANSFSKSAPECKVISEISRRRYYHLFVRKSIIYKSWKCPEDPTASLGPYLIFGLI